MDALLRFPTSDLNAQRAFADALPILIMVSDADGVVQFFNRAWHDYTGQPRFERDAHDDWRAYLHPDDVEQVHRAWYDAVSRGDREVRMRYRLRERATGEYRWFAAQAVGLSDERGAVAQWVGAAVDVHNEISVASAYQRASLPHALPGVPGLRVSATYRAAEDALLVGGDWYDAFVRADGSLALTIGDVVGHGLEAAVRMNRTRHACRTLMLMAEHLGLADPAAVLDAAETAVTVEYPDLLATALVGVLDLRARTFTYGCAGHPPPLVRTRAGVVRELPPSGTPLGCGLGGPRVPIVVPIDDLDALVLYTDGVIEGNKDALAGLATLSGALEGYTAGGGADAAAALLDAAGPSRRDDAAILAVERL